MMATQHYPGQYQLSASGYPRPPPGWRPPFQGPPPIPAGVNVNPQQWQTGFWQFNPAYMYMQGRQPAAAPSVPWVPGQAWQQAAGGAAGAAAASHNPYKRVPKPPSAEYLASKLSDNPLGLSNMIPAEQLYANQNPPGEEQPETPWIWNPRTLGNDAAEEGDRASSQEQARVRNDSKSSRRVQSPDGHYRSHSTSRARHTPESHTHTHTNQRHASEPPSSSSRQAAFDRPPDPRYRYTDPPAPQRRASVDQSRRPNTEAESFTTQRELQPTFSPNIVRTPGHYASPPPSRNSNSRNARSSSVDSTLSARMEQLSTGPNPPVRHSSMPQVPSGYSSASSSAMTGASHYVEEPTALLSPLMMNTPKPASRSMSRHSSVPAASLGPIPESSPSSSSYQTSSSRGTSRQSSRHTSPATSSSDRHVTPPHTTRLSNPLPPPPAEIRYTLPPPQRRSPPSGYRTRVRKGFWNKRGDHLTMEGYIVYAPRDQANPPELADYPAVNEGYRDHLDVFSRHVPRPELPESLPRQGQPPSRPYESFVVYEYR